MSLIKQSLHSCDRSLFLFRFEFEAFFMEAVFGTDVAKRGAFEEAISLLSTIYLHATVNVVVVFSFTLRNAKKNMRFSRMQACANLSQAGGKELEQATGTAEHHSITSWRVPRSLPR